jgi:hypothetical protein
MPTERQMERARREAAAVADRVQLRIIQEKVEAGKDLLPDEERLLLRKRRELLPPVEEINRQLQQLEDSLFSKKGTS